MFALENGFHIDLFHKSKILIVPVTGDSSQETDWRDSKHWDMTDNTGSCAQVIFNNSDLVYSRDYATLKFHMHIFPQVLKYIFHFLPEAFGEGFCQKATKKILVLHLNLNFYVYYSFHPLLYKVYFNAVRVFHCSVWTRVLPPGNCAPN